MTIVQACSIERPMRVNPVMWIPSSSSCKMIKVCRKFLAIRGALEWYTGAEKWPVTEADAEELKTLLKNTMSYNK